MALYSKSDIKTDLLANVYGSEDVSQPMPKYRMPEKEHGPRIAYSVIMDELMLDGNSRRNLATFCQTRLDD